MKIKEWTFEKKYNYLIITVLIFVGGMVLNIAVIMSNDCVMPVQYEKPFSTDGHKTLNAYDDVGDVKFLMLSDIYPIGSIIILSIGDILMAIGGYRLINGLIVHQLFFDVKRLFQGRKG